jgi:PilZ domain
VRRRVALTWQYRNPPSTAFKGLRLSRLDNDEGKPIRRATDQPKERRKHIRYPVGAAVFFSWRKGERSSFRSEGMTRDISLRGAYVSSATCPPVDTVVEMEIFLPQPLPRPSLLVVGRLRTRRIENLPKGLKGIGFAAVGRGFVVSLSSRRESHAGRAGRTPPKRAAGAIAAKKPAGGTVIVLESRKLDYGSTLSPR